MKQRFFAAFILAAAVLGTPAAAQAPAPKVFQFALQNGMQVVVVPDRRAPVVTQMLWYRVGAADDPQGLSGLAHLFQRMMFRGTAALPGDSFAATVARNGGTESAFTTHDATVYAERIPKDGLRTVMGLEADRMVNLDLSDANVRTERDIVTEERRTRIDDSPQALMREQVEAALYLSHPYGRPAIGWMDEIAHIGRDEARDFYARHYAPNACILVVAGDVTAGGVRGAAEAEYGKVPARELTPRAEFAQPPRLAETRMTIVRPDVKLPMLLRVYRVVSYAEAKPGEAEALATLAQLLGGGETSALYRKLVVERKIATEAGASYDGYARDDGEFSIHAVPRPGVALDALERAVDGVLKPYLEAPPSAAELARAKTQLVAGALYRRDDPTALATAYGRALAIGMTVDDVTQWPDRIRAVTAASVQQATASDLLPREAVTAYLKPGPAP